jgi:hypothetical protein
LALGRRCGGAAGTIMSTTCFQRRDSQMDQCRMNRAERLRELAGWYREFAERTENPAIWDSRLRTAENLEQAADDLCVTGAGRVHPESDVKVRRF